MKNAFLSMMLVVLTAIPAMAEDVDIILRFYKNRTEKDIPKEVNRAPMRLPVYVSYDTETGIIDVRGSESLDGEVYLCDADGVVKDYSPTINTSFEVASNGFYIIYIEGDGWYAEGIIEMD